MSFLIKDVSLVISALSCMSVSVAQNSNLKFGMHELNFKRNIFLFATNDMHQQNMLGLIYVSTTIVNYDRENISQLYVSFMHLPSQIKR